MILFLPLISTLPSTVLTEKASRGGEKISINTTSSSIIVAPGQQFGGKMQHIASGSNSLFSFDEKPYASAFHNCHLFMRMIMFRRDEERPKTKSTHHHSVADKHLSFDAIRCLFNRNGFPVQMFRQLKPEPLPLFSSCAVVDICGSLLLLVANCLESGTAGGIFRLNIHYSVKPILSFANSCHHPKKVYLSTGCGNVRVIALRHQHAVAFANNLDQLGFVRIRKQTARQMMAQACR